MRIQDRYQNSRTHLAAGHLAVTRLAARYLAVTHLAAGHLAVTRLAAGHLAVTRLAAGHLAVRCLAAGHLAIRHFAAGRLFAGLFAAGLLLGSCTSATDHRARDVSSADARAPTARVQPDRDPVTPVRPEKTPIDDHILAIHGAFDGITVSTSEDLVHILQSEPPGTIGLARSDADTLYVVGTTIDTDTDRDLRPFIREIGVYCEIGTFRPIPAAASLKYYGFEVSVTCGDRILTVFALKTAETDVLLRIEPFSSTSRTVLRDLDGNHTVELLRYSLLHSRGRPRELVLEAYRWTGSDFVLAASAAVLERLDRRFDLFEERLRNPPDAALVSGIDAALTPLEDAPPASTIVPAQFVLLPRLDDAPFRLGAPQWRMDREISLDGELYRFQVTIEANPLLDSIVTINGLD